MLDINFIKENKDVVRKAILDKQMNFNLDNLLDLDAKRRTLQQEIDELRQKRNQIAEAMKSGKRDDALIRNGKEIKQLLADLEKKHKMVKEEYDRLMWFVPQIPSSDTPVGKDES